MVAHARLKNKFTEDEKCQNLMSLFKCTLFCLNKICVSDGQFFATGEGVTGSFFSCHPEDYVFTFFCLDKTQEIVRYVKYL